MIYIDHSHQFFLKQELSRFLKEGSFASRLQKRLGETLHYWLVELEPSEYIEYLGADVEGLYSCAITTGGLDPKWLLNDDDRYVDDRGNQLPPSVDVSCSAVEQLAAYGLWLITEEQETLGSIPHEKDGEPPPEYNDQGWRRCDVIEHRAACMLWAYQALSYCQRIESGAGPTVYEIKRAETLNLSEMGRRAVASRTDQKLKPGWIEHCETVKKNNIAVSTLDDLLSVSGYNPGVLNVTPRTLKAWAKEAGISFKAGRPKK